MTTRTRLPAICAAFVAVTMIHTPLHCPAEGSSPLPCDAVRIFPRAGHAARMIGGEVQGSNESATGGFTTLTKIKESPKEGEWTRIVLPHGKAYRFLRYFGPEGSFTNIAEIEFQNNDQKLGGRPYGTFGSRDGSGNDFTKGFDGDTTTYFDAVAANAQYLGIDLGGEKAAENAMPTANSSGNGLRSYHIGNSLTDGMGEYTQKLAVAAGFTDHFMDRQTIPGSPLYLNYQSDGGFGTPYREAFVKLAPLSELVMQTFISNGDSDSPEFSLKFYDDARVNSPNIRPWIYGQWEDIGINKTNPSSPLWEARNRALMRIYMAHSLNFNALTKDRKSEVIAGGLALINLKKAFDEQRIPDLTDFFATNYADDLHLTENGRQFIGMVIFATLYDKSPVGLPIVSINENGPTLSPAQNKVYQQVAWETVQSFRKDRGASLAFDVPGEIDARTFVSCNIPIRGSRLGDIDANRSFLYLINAEKAGKYDFKASAVTDKSEMKLDVFVNHQSIGSVKVNPKGNSFAADTSVISVDLTAGVNLLRILVPVNRSYDLNSLTVSLPNIALKNTMPLLDLSVWQYDAKAGETITTNFRVFDAETPAAKLLVKLSSDNSALIPDSAMKTESGEYKGEYGEMYDRRLSITPAVGQSGEANITVTLSDADGSEREQTFKVKVK